MGGSHAIYYEIPYWTNHIYFINHGGLHRDFLCKGFISSRDVYGTRSDLYNGINNFIQIEIEGVERR